MCFISVVITWYGTAVTVYYLSKEDSHWRSSTFSFVRHQLLLCENSSFAVANEVGRIVAFSSYF